jgi:hypothetical protein
MADERRARKSTGAKSPVRTAGQFKSCLCPEGVSPDDLVALSRWLGGGVKEGSPRSLQARRTLARLLRSGYQDAHIGLRHVLADIFDPDSESDRQLILKRKPGRQRKVSRQSIAVFVWRIMQMGVPWESAVCAAMKEFGVVRSTVTDALEKWGKALPPFSPTNT